MHRALRVLLGLVLAAAALPLFTSSASAATLPPVLTSPQNGAAVSTNPPFTYQASAGASRYRVQIATDFGFTQVVTTIDTVNLVATYSNDLPNGTLFWRAASFDDQNNLSAYSQANSFVKTPGAPNPIAPKTPGGGGAATLNYPQDPIEFSWDPMPNTGYYQIDIDDEPSFSPPLVGGTDKTANSVYTWSTPNQMNKTLYWRVRSVSPQGFESANSTPQAFQIVWAYKPNLVYPPQDATVQEVRFDWDGGPNAATPGTPYKTIPGASSYDLLVSSDVNFNTIVYQAQDIRSTAFTPPRTFPAADYYWKVKAKNVAGVVSPESTIFHFKRAWPVPPGTGQLDTVSLLSPADNASIIEPNFAWTPAQLASYYEFWIGSDPAFSPGTYNICQTTHTTLTPYTPGCGLYPSIGVPTYYWKVKPIDGDTNIQGVFSNTRRFTYNPEYLPGNGYPGPISYVTPAGRVFTSAETPILSWNAFNTAATTPVTNPETTPAPDQTGFGRYQVQIYKNGSPWNQFNTYNTSIVPPVTFDIVNNVEVATTYSWRVVLLNSANQFGLAGPTRSFTITPRVTSPTLTITSAAGVSGVNGPLLSWTARTNAVRYDVMYGVRGTNIFNNTPLNASAYGITGTAFAPESDGTLTTGDWDFYVRAYDKDNLLIDVSNVSWFRINEIPKTNLTSPPNCTENVSCIVLNDTPTLDWDPVPRATHYILTLATDVNFTNVLNQYTSDTPYTKLRLVQALPDNQAGSNSYYWYARPCIGNRCAPGPETFAGLPSCYRVPPAAGACSPVRSFIKKSNVIKMLSPTPPPYTGGTTIPTATDEITFSWEDYLTTNRSIASNPLSDQEAQRYHIDVAYTENFQNGTILDQRELDATTYTDDRLYRDGPLFWRVQPIDGSGNYLPFPAAVGKINKASPTVTLKTPAAGASVKGIPSFKWDAQPYARYYTIEIYKNPQDGIQPNNLINEVSGQTQTPAWAPRNGLPAGTYGWRVRYNFGDQDQNESPFTGLRQFTLSPDAVTLTQPADGQLVAPNRVLFQWQRPTGNFSYYRFELSNSTAFTQLFDSGNTVTNAYAPVNAYTNGTWYWRIILKDANNNTLSTSSTRVIKIGQPGVTFKAVAPTRLLDSRLPQSQWGGTKLFQGSPRTLQVSQPFGVVPPTATAIIANVTATGSNAASFLTVYPADEPNIPTASNVNFAAGQTIPNLVTVKLSSAGAVKIATAVGSTDVILDVVGYFDDGTTVNDYFQGITPVRILDSRQASGPWGGTKLTGGNVRTLQVSGSQGIPSSAKSAVMNVTVTGSTQASFLTVFPGGNVPTSSNLNFAAGETIPNLVVTPLNNTGQASFYIPNGATDVIVDVVGYFGTSGDKFHFMSPVRILDSRTTNQAAPNVSWNNTKLGAGSKALQVAGVSGVPDDATSVVMNTTATGGTANSFLTVYPDGQTKPNSSNVNFGIGQTIPNLVMVKLGTNNQQFPQAQGKIDIFNAAGSVDVIADVVGYFAVQ